MPRIFIFTCGTSLISNFGKSKADPKDRASLQNGLETLVKRIDFTEEGWMGDSSWRDLTRGEVPGDPQFSDLLTVLQEDLAQAAVRYWSALPSNAEEQTAEMSTLAVLKQQPGDEIILLASDTPDGVFCALVNAHIMAEQGQEILLERFDWEKDGERSCAVVNWRGAPVPSGDDHSPPPIRVIVVGRLTPSNKLDFEKYGIGNLIRTLTYLVYEVYGRQEAIRPVFVFTGGFKASIPILTQAASWLGGSTGQHIEMTALYEASPDRIVVPVIGHQPEDKYLLIAFSFGIKKRPIDLRAYPEFKPFDYSDKRTAADVRECPFLFQDLPGGGIELNPLGQALKAIVEHALVDQREMMERKLREAAA